MLGSPTFTLLLTTTYVDRNVLCLEIFLDILCVYMSYLLCMVPFFLQGGDRVGVASKEDGVDLN